MPERGDKKLYFYLLSLHSTVVCKLYLKKYLFVYFHYRMSFFSGIWSLNLRRNKAIFLLTETQQGEKFHYIFSEMNVIAKKRIVGERASVGVSFSSRTMFCEVRLTEMKYMKNDFSSLFRTHFLNLECCVIYITHPHTKYLDY